MVLHWQGHTALQGPGPQEADLGNGASLGEAVPGGPCGRPLPVVDLSAGAGAFLELRAGGSSGVRGSSEKGPDPFDGGNEFTVELWLQLGSATASGTVAAKCGPGAGWELRQHEDVVQLSVALQRLGRSWRHTLEHTLQSPPSLEAPPLHLAAVLGGGRARLFVDGDESGTRHRPDAGWSSECREDGACLVPWRPWASPLCLGRHPSHAERGCPCRIFALRLSHEALAPADFLPRPPGELDRSAQQRRQKR